MHQDSISNKTKKNVYKLSNSQLCAMHNWHGIVHVAIKRPHVIRKARSE